MYAGTKVNWHEVLMSNAVAENSNESLPLFLCVFSADKGTEEITDLTYTDFRKMYGDNADFFKHGQPLIQAHKILAAGGRVLGKRLVADDATLANLVILAEIIVSDIPTVKFTKQTVTDAKTFAQVKDAALELKTTTTFPLFIICDNGRGESFKNVRIAPDYDASKTLDFMLYNIQDIEGVTVMESNRFSLDPDAITYSGNSKKNMALQKSTMNQIKAECLVDSFKEFIDKLGTEAGYVIPDEETGENIVDYSTLYNLDILNACSKKGLPLTTFNVDTTELDMKATYGYTLKSGDNGSFGSAPFPGENGASTEWINTATEFLSAEVPSPYYSYDEIYDLDYHKIDFCVDANYPDDIKNLIVELANFREDFFYFRDLGIDIDNIDEVIEKVGDATWSHSPFVGDYMTTYDIIDDFSKKQIKVTMLHGVAPLLVNHYMNNPNAPIAGEFNHFIITEMVDNTLNIIPRITPKRDMKTELDDLRVNYANYSSDDGIITVQSTYTSQDHWGPLSYSSNVIITQMCIKDIRRYCPKIRFMLMDGNDFAQYKKLIQDNVISYYEKYFKSIELIYTKDDVMTAQKIFNASLYCYYKDFPQGEIFDVFAIEGNPESNPAY